MLSLRLIAVCYLRCGARWDVAMVFVESHISRSRALRRVPKLRDEVKSMVVGRSHGEVRALINIPFDAVLDGRL